MRNNIHSFHTLNQDHRRHPSFTTNMVCAHHRHRLGALSMQHYLQCNSLPFSSTCCLEPFSLVFFFMIASCAQDHHSTCIITTTNRSSFPHHHLALRLILRAIAWSSCFCSQQRIAFLGGLACARCWYVTECPAPAPVIICRVNQPLGAFLCVAYFDYHNHAALLLITLADKFECALHNIGTCNHHEHQFSHHFSADCILENDAHLAPQFSVLFQITAKLSLLNEITHCEFQAFVITSFWN